ncbi:MAG TPA: NAD(P)-dependent oxidoreductase [Mycobacteriales bacterium]|jgi:nucleoside-diphosphate-sugar epimerase|nr:NAD(P)-dependent oxidoreductase [Mycobacteriales bacterium]
MRIFLAGATGAIGRELTPALLRAGHEVVGLTRTEPGAAWLRSIGATGVLGDIFDRAAVHRLVAEAEPDVIMHQLTALSERDFAANSRIRREGTRRLVEAAEAVGVTRMIAQSISWVYEPGSTPAAEATPLDPTDAQPRADTVDGVRALEATVGELADHVVLRFGLLYGPGTWYSRDGLLGEQARRGELVAADGIASFVHVADAARATLLALDWPAGMVNVVDDEPAAGHEWAPVFAAAVGGSTPTLTSGGEPWERGADNTLARRLGWAPIYPSWRDGFAELRCEL